MSDSESNQSDIVIKSALPKKKIKLPTLSPVDNLKKGTTKAMIHEALTELKTRKGVSLHAIKKYLIEKHSVDTEKINFLIKKTINTGVKEGSIIQVKGVGATGSFKLAPEKTKAKPKSKEKPEKLKNENKPKPEKQKTEKEKTKKEKKTEPENKTKKVKPNKADDEKPVATKKDSKIKQIKEKKENKTTKENKERQNKKEKLNKTDKITKTDKKTKMTATQTPSKKTAVSIKSRRSIGNIIKPPKMNPKSS